MIRPNQTTDRGVAYAPLADLNKNSEFAEIGHNDESDVCLLLEPQNQPDSFYRHQVVNTECTSTSEQRVKLDASVVLLTHYLPLYQVRVYQELASQLGSLKILLSTPIEPNRNFEIDWGGLDVSIQKNVMIRRHWKHQSGFRDEQYLHVPYDTFRLLHRLKPDVVLSHELGARSAVAAFYRRLSRSARLILMTYMSEHTEQGRGPFRTRFRKFLLNQADAVTFNGPSCRRYLLENGVGQDRMFHLPYAADDRAVHACQVRNEAEVRNRLICVGQLNQRKGVLPLISQLVNYCNTRPHQKIDLTFVGSGPLYRELNEYPRPQNLEVTILSKLTPAELSKSYYNYGAAIHPTLADEWLMVLNESFHTGLVMIGSRYAQAVETLVSEGENGWIFDPLVETSLHEKLDEYFATPADKLARMRTNAIETVRHITPSWAASGAVRAIQWVLDK